MLTECKDFQKRINKTHRFFVPDLAPWDRPIFAQLKPKWIFVAESPHVNEVEPPLVKDRRPLCGKAGQKWWNLLSELWSDPIDAGLSSRDLEQFCLKHRLFVMNAVQLPLDPKIVSHFPGADPILTLGFHKGSGPFSFKALKRAPSVQGAFSSLRQRLMRPECHSAPMICLGNDAHWFVEQVLLSSDSPLKEKVEEKIPHPSAWWRRGGYYGRVAQERLESLVNFA
jgi:hypothetical protein